MLIITRYESTDRIGPDDEREEWRVERDTWDLVSRLYAYVLYIH